MSLNKLRPDDPRVSHHEAVLNGHKYHYILGLPQDGRFKATVFLVHGWPDLSFGWRYQIPFLTARQLRVVAPDMMGYGRTDAPQVPPKERLHLYSFKRAADDLAELARLLDAPKIILGGHDWGGMIVYRTAMWHPDLVSHLFSVCTPYLSPSDKFISTSDLVKGPLPHFGYQLQLAGPEVEAGIKTREQIGQFFKGLYGGRSAQGQPVFRPDTGLDFEGLKTVGDPPLLDDKELEFYVQEYLRHGFHGPLNWYRTREVNFQEDLGLGSKMVEQPVLFIAGKNDLVLKPEMSRGMEALIPKLKRQEVDSGHWALTQKPDEVNRFLEEWLDEVVFGTKSTL